VNDFNKEDLARWYMDAYNCFWCEINEPDMNKWNSGDCFHHILGRRGNYNNSILNSFFINNDMCHLPRHPMLRKKENKIRMLKKTIEWLAKQGYEFTKLDTNFIANNKSLYEKVLEQHENE
jgi:hypothetical protein